MMTGVAGAVLAVASLSGCGGQSDQEFCDTWERGSSDSETLDEVQDELSTLEDNAPSDIEEQVQTLVDQTEKIFEAVDEAGIDIGDKTFDELATDLSAEDQQKFAHAFSSADQDALDSAGEDVHTWVDDNCAA